MTNILLLGVTGFLGKSLLDKLEKSNSVKMMIHNSDLETSAKKFKGNILSPDSFIDQIDDDLIIINFAIRLSFKKKDN